MIHYIVGRNLGHLTRCVANISKLELISDEPVDIYTFAHSDAWLRSNLPDRKIKSINTHQLTEDANKFLKADLLVHDWREEVKTLKQQRKGKGPIICGIYHSEITKSRSDTEWTIKFKQQVRTISDQTTDIFFHINLTQPKRIPKLSTFYVPIPLITREIAMSPEEVKETLGIPENEPFLLVQMGGGTGKYRYKYIQEWYEKVNHLRIPYRIVIAKQIEDRNFDFHQQITLAPLFPNGRELVNAASLVISKPGMGILMDCISTGTPLLALPADTKEREVKNLMLQHLAGTDLCLASNYFSTADLANRIEEVIRHSDHFKNVFAQVPQSGADIMAKSIQLLSGRSLDELPELYEEILTFTPFRVR